MAKGNFLFGFLLGGAAAFAATRLLAPESSDELRDNVARKVNQFRDKAADYADFADETADEFTDIAGDTFDDLSETASSTADEAKSAAAYAKDSAAAIHDTDYADINLEGQSAFGAAKDAESETPESDASTSETSEK
ncbi:YtxH domain-containing protein [Loigolactobacillus zhaoyuanensis]|uniref:YtxH domain-containing protein n=1 Tax=Loigolactobacillus zhaoyuanensis TaxID=2486017 RepID=A0ABW8UF94_9LACO|nr:YtxH domain-containing protein [Loigolactobacillus zhaoyuanensis]